MSMFKSRRDLLMLLGAQTAWPLAARAQQPPLSTIGFLYSQSRDTADRMLASFRRGLKEHGYIEGQNLLIRYYLADNQLGNLPGMARELVRQKVDAIATVGVPATAAAKMATHSIPIVFNIGTDPVEGGLVANLSRPGGNLTGTTNLNSEVIEKRLQVLHELVPGGTTIAYLAGTKGPSWEGNIARVQRAARELRVHLVFVNIAVLSDLDAAFDTIVQQGAAAVEINPDPFLETEPIRDRIIALAARRGIPAVFPYPEIVSAGGLMSYGTDYSETWRVTGVYMGRVLRGESPSSLPVQQATKMQLLINLKTAKALALTIPLTLRARATEVIE